MAKPTAAEKRVLLPGVSWQQFEQVIAELGPERTTRLTYDRGKLEMMTPQEEHDRCHRLIESLILVVADELYLKVESRGPILLKRPDLGRAAEPDACYYLQLQRETRNLTELDLTQAIPPDLVVEVAMTKSALNKLSVYADLGIPEVWQYLTRVGEDVLKGELVIYRLENQQYVASPTSAAFPMLPAARILEFLEQSDTLGLQKALTLLRAWLAEKL